MTKARDLKAQAHALKPVVRVGQKGLTEEVKIEINAALDHHELIKIKLVADRDQRTRWVEQLVRECEAEHIGSIGQITILYKQAQ